ncbi:CHY zinc finger protein [Virgibacillus byunsanensis]|uniref:CHY zinc finger protein n=1 Tax=Virgibacillus byunsanensis TaxID=570945 RepID=A0ABW3LSC3_9BACI
MNRHAVTGAIDSETRCEHYHEENDRIAIKFYCCMAYFPCYLCHQTHGCGQKRVWPKEAFNQYALLCGGCGVELTINEYLNSHYSCPSCNAAFNPGCSLHAHLYFAR